MGPHSAVVAHTAELPRRTRRHVRARHSHRARLQDRPPKRAEFSLRADKRLIAKPAARNGRTGRMRSKVAPPTPTDLPGLDASRDVVARQHHGDDERGAGHRCRSAGQRQLQRRGAAGPSDPIRYTNRVSRPRAEQGAPQMTSADMMPNHATPMTTASAAPALTPRNADHERVAGNALHDGTGQPERRSGEQSQNGAQRIQLRRRHWPTVSSVRPCRARRMSLERNLARAYYHRERA